MVAANREEKSKPGSVGPPLPRVEVKVVEIESYRPLPQGETGMLLVHGPNVFPGYIGEGEQPVHRTGWQTLVCHRRSGAD